MKARLLLLALRASASSHTIDFSVGSRTYQVSGANGMTGFWERIFHQNSHPTRRRMSDVEMQTALDSAKAFTLWTGPTSSRIVTAAELETELAPMPVR